MAKAPKTITPAEKKLALANMKEAMKNHAALIKGIDVESKAAEKALADAKKSADAAIKEAEKAAAAKRKAADAAIVAAQKAYAAAVEKAEKSKAAAAKGSAKLLGQLDALDSITVVAAPKVKAPVPAPVLEAA